MKRSEYVIPNASALSSWRKSSYSGHSGGDCVEIGTAARLVPVRDSKDPHGPAVLFDAGAWSTFVESVRREG